MKRFLAAIAVVVSAVSPSWGAGMKWLAPGEAAKITGKAIYYFRQDQVALCMIAEEDVWTDQRVIAAAGAMPCVLIDLASDSATGLAREHGVLVVPTTLLVENGKEIGRLSRSTRPEEYVALAEGKPIAATPMPAAPSTTTARVVEAADPTGDGAPAPLDITMVKGAITAEGINLELTLAGPVNTSFAAAYNFFLDADQSEATGHAGAAFKGADFLVQGATVFRFNGKTQEEWGWEQIGAAKNNAAGNTVRVAIPASLIPPSPAPFVYACSQNEQWTTIDWAPATARLSLAGVAAIAPVAAAPAAPGAEFKDAAGDGPGSEDLLGAAVSSSGDNLAIRLSFSAPPVVERQHVFIDADKVETTGYSDGVRNGADFMIEGNTLYRHKGGSTGWDWNSLGAVEFKIEGNTGTYTVPRSRIGAKAGAAIKLWFTTTGADWAPADFLPDAGTVELVIPQ